MRIIIARHGETELNTKDMLQGASCSPLTAKGKEHARLLGEFSKKEGVKKIFSSPLDRALQTAKRVAELTNKNVEIDERLREICYGSWEKRVKQELKETTEWKKRNEDKYGFTHPGEFEGVPGESYADRYPITAAFFKELIEKCSPEETLLIVAHLGVSRAAKQYFEDLSGKEAIKFSPYNDEILIVDIDEGNVKTSLHQL